jgi:hypothetical protein
MPIRDWIAAFHKDWAGVEPGCLCSVRLYEAPHLECGLMLKPLAIATLLFSSVIFSQTAPNAIGQPETSLAGIDPHHTTIADIQKLYGLQEAMIAVPPNPYPEGTRLYKWRRLTATLKVLTEPSPNGEVIRAIEVAGEGEPGDQPINKTGRGLKLGAKAAEIKKLYGIEPAKGETTIKWPDGTTLVVGTNEKGRVSKIELRTSN